jgi:hypothetical protein
MKIENRSRKNILLIGAIFQAASLIVTAVVLWLFSVTVWHAYSSKDWPVIDGMVSVTPRLVQNVTSPEPGPIWYQYSVAGKIYSSSRNSFFDQGTALSNKEGTPVKVFYNPIDHSDSCLVRGVSTYALMRLALLIFTFLFGAFMFVVIVHARFKKASENERMTDMPVRFAVLTIIREVFLH